MIGKSKQFLSVILLIFVFAIPGKVWAEEELPPANPGGRITGPIITGVNPDPDPTEGQLSEIEITGGVQQQSLGVSVSSETPPLMNVAEQMVIEAPLMESSLAVPMRVQDPLDVSCGVQALGMVMDYLALDEGQEAAPRSEELLTALKDGSLLHEWGTGVEELAYVARQKGYAGSYSFHDWTLGQIQNQLALGRPVVVSLGVNGEGKPGHFVTVTGISEDGQWVSYNDPARGRITVPTAEFMVHWSWQGYSGMITQREALVKKADPMLPVMGMFSALSAMTVMFSNLSKQQQGLLQVLRPKGGGVPLVKRSRGRSPRVRNLEKAQQLRRPGSRAWPTGEGRPVPGKLSRHKRPNAVRQKRKKPVQRASGLVTWRSQAFPSAKEQKMAADQLHRKRAEVVQAEKQSRDLVSSAEASGHRLVFRAQSALVQSQRHSEIYQQQARQRGDRTVAQARREYAQAQNRAKVMLAQARSQGAAWVRTANRKLNQARSTAGSWLSNAVRRGRGLTQSANHRLRQAYRRGKYYSRRVWRRSGRWGKWTKNFGRRRGRGNRLVAGAQRNVSREHRRSRNSSARWRNRKMSGAQGNFSRAVYRRTSNYWFYKRGRGNRLVTDAQRDVVKAQGRANRLMGSTQARANRLISQARSKLKRTQAKAARLLEKSRQRGRELVGKASGDLAAARRQKLSQIKQAKKRGAALVAKARSAVQRAQARLIQPLVRQLALRRIIELEVIKRRIAMMIDLMRRFLSNPKRLGIGGGIRLSDLRARVSRAGKSRFSKPRSVVKTISKPPSKPEKREQEPDPRPSWRAAAALAAERQAAARAAQAEQERVARLKREAEAEAQRKATEEAARNAAAEAANQRAAAALAAERQAAARAAQAEQERVAALKRNQRSQSAGTSLNAGSVKGTNGGNANSVASNPPISQPKSAANVQASQATQAVNTPGASVFAGDLGDAEVRAQIAAVGGDPNMDIKQARAIIHNARIASKFRAQQMEQERYQNAKENLPTLMAKLPKDELQAGFGITANQQVEQARRQHAVENLPGLFVKLPREELFAGLGLLAKQPAQQREQDRRQKAVANLPDLFDMLSQDELLRGTNLLERQQRMAMANSLASWKSVDMANTAEVIARRERSWWQNAVIDTASLWQKFDQSAGQWVRDKFRRPTQNYANWVQNPNQLLEIDAATRNVQTVAVPSFWLHPVDWLQSKLINTGRQNKQNEKKIIAIANRNNTLTSRSQQAVASLFASTIQSIGIVHQQSRSRAMVGLEPLPQGIKNHWHLVGNTFFNALNFASMGILDTTRKAFSSNTARLIYASTLMAINEAIAHTSHHSLRVLTEKRFSHRLGASAEAAFGLFNLISFGALGDIRYGMKEKDWLRVAGGTVGLIPFLGIARGGHVLYQGGKSALRAVGTSLFTRGASGSISQAVRGSWDDVLRFLRHQRVQDFRRIMPIVGYDVARAQKLSSLITQADEISDGIMFAREINQGIANDDPLQIALGLFFGLTTGVGIATNKLTRPGLSNTEIFTLLQQSSRSEIQILEIYKSRYGYSTTAEIRKAYLDASIFRKLESPPGMLNKYVLRDLFSNGYGLDDLPEAKLDALLEYFKTPQGQEFWLNDTMYLGRQFDIYEFMSGNTSLNGISLHSYDSYSGYLNEGLIDLANSVGYQARGISTVMGVETSVTMNEYLYLMSKYQNIFDLDGNRLTIEGFARK